MARSSVPGVRMNRRRTIDKLPGDGDSRFRPFVIADSCSRSLVRPNNGSTRPACGIAGSLAATSRPRGPMINRKLITESQKPKAESRKPKTECQKSNSRSAGASRSASNSSSPAFLRRFLSSATRRGAPTPNNYSAEAPTSGLSS
jgi:hypothetical protein